MKKPSDGAPRPRRRLTAALACAALAVCIPAAASVAGRLTWPAAGGRSSAPAPAAVPPAHAAAPADDHAGRLETELVTVTPTGFDPAELTLPAAPFILEVDNRSGLEELSLRLDPVRGGPAREARVRRSAPEWSDRLDLHPGTYVLREAAHPGWECRIIVTPR